MKQINFIFISIICGILATSCGNKSNNTYETITVNFNSYTEKTLSENPQDFYSQKRYVVLHSDNLNMTMQNISHMVLYGGKMYMSDSYTRNFVVYDMNGHAIAKVGNRGRGPGEYLNLDYFDVDDQGRIHVMDGNMGNDQLLIYDADYKFVEAKELPFEVDIIKCMPDGGYLFGLASWDNSRYGGTRIVRTNSDLQVLNEVDKYDKELTDDNFQFSNYYFIEMPEGIFYHRSPEENVWLLNENGDIQRKYYFDLGSNAIPIQYRSNITPLVESEDIVSYQALMSFAVPHGKYIFGKMYDKGIFKSYIYDSGNNVIYTKNDTDPDNFGSIFAINSEYLITIFPYLDDENIPENLPEEMRPMVLSGDQLICLYKLN